MRFRDYLIDSAYEPSPLSGQDFIKWLETHSEKFLSHKHFIYRGMEVNAPIGVIDTNGFARKSADTFNYYTVWCDYDPTWADYPKRSKSYIASGNMAYADGFGILYTLFPADSCNIGYCPSDDFWNAFENHYVSTMGSIVGDMGDELRFINHVLKFMAKKDSSTKKFVDEAEYDYSSLCKAFSYVTLEVLVEFSKERDNSSFDSEHALDIAKKMSASGKANFLEMWRVAMNPSKNRFTHSLAGSLLHPGKNELWVQGKVAVLDTNQIPKVVREFLEERGFNTSELP